MTRATTTSATGMDLTRVEAARGSRGAPPRTVDAGLFSPRSRVQIRSGEGVVRLHGRGRWDR